MRRPGQGFPEIAVKTAAPIIERFGGITKMAELTGLPYGRIHGWMNNGVIPEKYRYGILLAAKEHGIPHTAWDYISHLVDVADREVIAAH